MTLLCDLNNELIIKFRKTFYLNPKQLIILIVIRFDPKSPQILSEMTFNLTALKNLGNTCYMNTTIQALFATKEFREYILENKVISTLHTWM